MPATALVTLSGTNSATPLGSQVIGPFTLASAAANATIQQAELANGNNTITVPTSPAPVAVIVQLPSNNTVTVRLKMDSGDTGIVISKTGWFILPFDTAAVSASFILNSNGAQTGKLTTIMFI